MLQTRKSAQRNRDCPNRGSGGGGGGGGTACGSGTGTGSYRGNGGGGGCSGSGRSSQRVIAVACVASASGSIVAITQLFVSAVTCKVAFTNVMSFAHLSSAQYSNCHPCIEH